MERLTHERVNGIKTGYWSAATKEVLVQKLAAYENTGYEDVYKRQARHRGGDDMRVLSLFDGIATGRRALEMAGVPVDLYIASEIDLSLIHILQLHQEPAGSHAARQGRRRGRV